MWGLGTISGGRPTGEAFGVGTLFTPLTSHPGKTSHDVAALTPLTSPATANAAAAAPSKNPRRPSPGTPAFIEQLCGLARRRTAGRAADEENARACGARETHSAAASAAANRVRAFMVEGLGLGCPVI